VRVRALAASALFALVLCGCTKVGQNVASSANGPGGGGPSGPHADRLVIATNADPRNLNPALASASPVLDLSAFMFSYTIRYDEHAKPVPDAVSEIPTVENGDVSKDGLTIRYKLRHNIKWHDGEPLTCADMAFTWQVMINPKNNVVTTDGWKDIKNVDCRDPYVAVVHMKKVYAPFLQQLWSVNGNGPILPEHLLAKYNDAHGSFNTAAYNSAPVGSGPYTFVAWNRGSDVRMQAFPGYFLGKPKIAEVVYKIIPDGNTLTTQVQTHEVDVAWNLPPAAYNRIKAVPGVDVDSPVVYTYDHIDFNLKRPIFADVRVRRALAYAIDRAALLDKVQHGLGELTDTFECKTLYPDSYDADTMKYPYDVQKANALLDEAGWKTGRDGIRTKNGQRLAFQISTQTESTTGQAIQAQVQTYWRAVGADAEVKNYPTSLFFDNTATGILQGGKYDVAFFAWVGAADIDQGAIYSAHYLAPKGQNALFWQNARATAMMDDANLTVDQKRRIADYRIVQEEFAKDVPSVVLWYRREVISRDARLKDFSDTPVITTPFWNTWQYRY
jgi:peptide/nickel transport system substrate-binding protein